LRQEKLEAELKECTFQPNLQRRPREAASKVQCLEKVKQAFQEELVNEKKLSLYAKEPK
jgi:hypothetical protein